MGVSPHKRKAGNNGVSQQKRRRVALPVADASQRNVPLAPQPSGSGESIPIMEAQETNNIASASQCSRSLLLATQPLRSLRNEAHVSPLEQRGESDYTRDWDKQENKHTLGPALETQEQDISTQVNVGPPEQRGQSGYERGLDEQENAHASGSQSVLSEDDDTVETQKQGIPTPPKDDFRGLPESFFTSNLLRSLLSSAVVFACVDVWIQIGLQDKDSRDEFASSHEWYEYDSHQTLRMIKLGLLYGFLGQCFYEHLDSICERFVVRAPCAKLVSVLLKVMVEQWLMARISLEMSRLFQLEVPFFPPPIAFPPSSAISSVLVVGTQCINFLLTSPQRQVRFCLLMMLGPLAALDFINALKALTWPSESSNLDIDLVCMVVPSFLFTIMGTYRMILASG